MLLLQLLLLLLHLLQLLLASAAISADAVICSWLCSTEQKKTKAGFGCEGKKVGFLVYLCSFYDTHA